MIVNVLSLDDHRTNNDLEGWHLQMNKRLTGIQHGIWGFIEQVQVENLRTQNDIRIIENGGLLKVRSKEILQRIIRMLAIKFK